MQILSALPATRPPFLVLAPVCVLLGLSLVYSQHSELNLITALITLIGALSAAIAVNTINEYQDFESGLDSMTDRTPFSGGSGLLVHQPELKITVKLIAIASCILTFVIGLFFAFNVGIDIIPIGLLGLLIIVTYTKFINRHALICYITPGIGFGILMVLGTVVVQGHNIELMHLLVAMIPALLINNLLLVNQFPDIAADTKVGRNHFAIAFGTYHAANLYICGAIFTLVIFVALVIYKILPSITLLAALPISMSYFVYLALRQYGENLAKNSKYMALNVIITLMTPSIIALSLFNDG